MISNKSTYYESTDDMLFVTRVITNRLGTIKNHDVNSIVLSKSVVTLRHKVNKLHFLITVITEFSVVVRCFLLSCML